MPVSVRRLTAARLRNTPIGASPLCGFCSATFFCARKNASHFSLSGAKKRQLPGTLNDIFSRIIYGIKVMYDTNYFRNNVLFLYVSNERRKEKGLRF